MNTVKLIENFRSFQGEGPDCGKSMLILRFKYCNRVEYADSNPCEYCDTLLKMRISTETTSTLNEIQETINKSSCGTLISGGEPTFDNQFEQTLILLNELDYPISNVETNGYNLKGLLEKTNCNKNVKFIYSPKFFTAEELNKEIELTNKVYNDNRVYIKVVGEDNEFINLYLKHVRDLNINNKTYIMPQGKNKDELIKNATHCFDLAEEFNMNFSSRDHIIYEFI